MLYEKDVLYAQFGIASDMAAIVSKKEYEKEYLLMEPPH